MQKYLHNILKLLLVAVFGVLLYVSGILIDQIFQDILIKRNPFPILGLKRMQII